MIKHISYRYKLAKLQKARRDILEKSPKPIVGQEFEADYSTEKELIIAEHKIYRHILDHFYEKAFQYGIPLPDDDNYWEKSEAYPGTDHLNRKGLSRLRASIHEEQKRRLEIYSVLVAGFTGLIGTLTGLVAVFASYS